MVTNRSLANNWLLLALVSVVSFGGAVLYMLVDSPTSSVFLLYFVITASLIAGTALWWFGKHPPRMTSPGWMYVAVVITLIGCGTFLSMIPGTRAVASWLTLGACFALYGVLERSVAIVSAGLITVAVTVVVYTTGPARLGLILETVTGTVFAITAVAVARSSHADERQLGMKGQQNPHRHGDATGHGHRGHEGRRAGRPQPDGQLCP